MSDVNGDVPIRQCPKCSGPVILKDVLAAPESSSSRVTVYQEQVCVICCWQPTRRPPDSGSVSYSPNGSSISKHKGNSHHPSPSVKEPRVLELHLTIYEHPNGFSIAPQDIVIPHRITVHLVSRQRQRRKRPLWHLIQVELCPALLQLHTSARHGLRVVTLNQLFNALAAHGISPQEVMGILARFPGSQPYWTEVYDEWLQVREGKSSG